MSSFLIDELAIDEEEDNIENEVLRLLAKGKKSIDDGSVEEAVEIFKRFCRFGKACFAEDKTDYELYVMALVYLGEAQRKGERHKDALQTYEELLLMSKEISDVELEADTHSLLSETYEEYGEFVTQSITHLTRQYELITTHSLKSPEDVAKLGYGLAERHRILGETTKALDIANEALAQGLAAGATAKRVVAALHTSMGRSYLRCGELQKAEESFEASCSIASNDEQAQHALMDSYLGLAELAAIRDDEEKLEELLAKAESEVSSAHYEADDRENAKVLCRMYSELAALRGATGNFKEADGYIQKSLALARKSGYKVDLCECLLWSAQAYMSSGELSKALTCCYEIQEVSRPQRYRHLEYIAFRMLTEVHKSLGNLDEALTYCEKLLESLYHYHEDNQTMKANSLAQFGFVYLAKADFDEDATEKTANLLRAIKLIESSAALQEELGDAYNLCQTLTALAFAYHGRNDLETALKYAEKAWVLMEHCKDKAVRADNLHTRGSIKMALGCIDEAEEIFKTALLLSLETEDQKLISGSYDRLGFIALRKNDMESAILHLRKSISVTDCIRRAINQQAQKISFMEIRTRSYSILELVYLQYGRFNDALVTSERRKARAFIEMIHARHLPRDHLSMLQSRTEPSIEKLGRIVGAEKAMFVVFSDHKDPNDTLKLAVWLLAPGRGVFDIEVLTEVANLADMVQNLRRLICPEDQVPIRKSRDIKERNIVFEDGIDNSRHTGRITSNLDQLLKQLYELLFGKIHACLEKEVAQSGCRSLVIVPSRALFLTPFAAFITPDGQRMYEKYNLRITAAIQALEFNEAKKPARSKSDEINVLTVGNPSVPTVKLYGTEMTPETLDGAKSEAEEVAQSFESKPLTGKEATREAVLSCLPSADLVHFACHGSWQYKALLLAPSVERPLDGYTEEHVLLTAGDVLKLELKAKLVVLSACNSGTGTLNSEGVVGLTRSFLAAGALAVIAALWLLPDDATQLFMGCFYRSWRSGRLASESLREATEAIQTRNPLYQHPFFWAPFVLVGHDVRLE